MEADLQNAPFVGKKFDYEMEGEIPIFVGCRALMRRSYVTHTHTHTHSQFTPIVADLQVLSLGRQFSAILFRTDARFGAF